MNRVGASVGAVAVLACAAFIASALSARTEAKGSAGSQARIAFSSDRDGNFEVYVMNADGSSQRRLTRNTSHDGSPAWSPDGRRIAFTHAIIYSTLDRDDYGEIYVMNADGSGQRNLTRYRGNDEDPAWSPDVRRIAFTSYRDNLHGAAEVYVMNADGSDQRRLTGNKRRWNYDAVWSPDGRRIAFVSERDSAADSSNSEVYVMNADGSSQRRLTRNKADDHEPVWSPDGRRIAFSSDRGGNFEVYVMNADGSGQRNLTRNKVDDYTPAWSPDGRRIAFTSKRDGDGEIYVMNADGSGQRRLTRNIWWDADPVWSPAP